MTNSPPSNVKTGSDESVRVLASGIDSLVLAIDVQWPNDRAFLNLAEHKARAKASSNDEPVELVVGDGSIPWRFNVKPHGIEGYEWILDGKEFGMKIGSWLEPQQRPSMMVDLRSETLWMHGPDKAVDRVISLIGALGGHALTVKPSRIDLCVDVMIHERDWNPALIDSFVTRAKMIDPHYQNRVLTGYSIGRGKVSARLYDKPIEIRVKSHKIWMYDIWGIESVPAERRIIRVEYQIRREAMREFKINTWNDLRSKLDNLWAYCTHRWLHLANDAALHHTQQEPIPWWPTVQAGFGGAQGAEPLVRDRAIVSDKRQLSAQAIGILASIVAVELGADEVGHHDSLDLESFSRMALEEAMRHIDYDDSEFTKRIRRKQGKLRRCGPGFTEGE